MQRKLKRLHTPLNRFQYIMDHEVRKELSPFMFLDAGAMTRNDGGLFIGKHPHSGIGIITYFEGADLDHSDSGDNDDIIRDGGVQWIQAGGGVWHREHYKKKASVKSENWDMSLIQLWLQLPESIEESEVEYQNFQSEKVPQIGNVKLVTGTYKGVTSPLVTPYNMTYLLIELKAGEKFEFETPAGQNRGFILPNIGEVELSGDSIPLKQLSILEESEGTINIETKTDSKFALILAAEQNHDIITHSGSIHTNMKALERSIERIQQSR